MYLTAADLPRARSSLTSSAQLSNSPSDTLPGFPFLACFRSSDLLLPLSLCLCSIPYFGNPYQTFMLLYFPAANHFIISTLLCISGPLLSFFLNCYTNIVNVLFHSHGYIFLLPLCSFLTHTICLQLKDADITPKTPFLSSTLSFATHSISARHLPLFFLLWISSSGS